MRVIPAGAAGAFVAPQEPAEVSISLGGAVGTWPGVGVGVASHGDALTAEETARLSALQLAHGLTADN